MIRLISYDITLMQHSETLRPQYSTVCSSAQVVVLLIFQMCFTWPGDEQPLKASEFLLHTEASAFGTSGLCVLRRFRRMSLLNG